MKFLVALALVVVVVARPGDHYDSKFDNFNVDEVIDNDRLFKAYLLCFLDEGNCTPEGKELKGLIPEGTKTACGKCTEAQKPLVAKFMHAIQVKAPEKWKILNDQNDPERKYQEVLEKFIKEHYH